MGCKDPGGASAKSKDGLYGKKPKDGEKDFQKGPPKGDGKGGKGGEGPKSGEMKDGKCVCDDEEGQETWKKIVKVIIGLVVIILGIWFISWIVKRCRNKDGKSTYECVCCCKKIQTPRNIDVVESQGQGAERVIVNYQAPPVTGTAANGPEVDNVRIVDVNAKVNGARPEHEYTRQASNVTATYGKHSQVHPSEEEDHSPAPSP